MNRDRYRGCLLGQALGDALGFAVEGQPPQVCTLQLQALLARIERAADGSWQPVPLGITRDLELAAGQTVEVWF